MKIEIDAFSPRSIDAAIKKLEDYNRELKRKCETLAKRLAEMGAVNVSIGFAQAIYDGEPDFNIEVQRIDEGTYSVVAKGETVLFMEFGTGVYHPDTHPKAAELGMVRGEYGKGHGKQLTWGYYGEPGTNGWKDPRRPGVVLTHGNPANMPMYNTAQDLKREIRRVAEEVFRS